MNLTPQQWLAIVVAICAFLSGGSAAAQMSDIIGPPLAHTVGSIFGLAAGIGSIILATVTSQKAQVTSVEAMPGVTKIVTNPQANTTLRALADSDAHPKVE